MARDRGRTVDRQSLGGLRCLVAPGGPVGAQDAPFCGGVDVSLRERRDLGGVHPRAAPGPGRYGADPAVCGDGARAGVSVCGAGHGRTRGPSAGVDTPPPGPAVDALGGSGSGSARNSGSGGSRRARAHGRLCCSPAKQGSGRPPGRMPGGCRSPRPTACGSAGGNA